MNLKTLKNKQNSFAMKCITGTARMRNESLKNQQHTTGQEKTVQARGLSGTEVTGCNSPFFLDKTLPCYASSEAENEEVEKFFILLLTGY